MSAGTHDRCWAEFLMREKPEGHARIWMHLPRKLMSSGLGHSTQSNGFAERQVSDPTTDVVGEAVVVVAAMHLRFVRVVPSGR